eukprot:10376385-Heterocapsa_arctica.AAC.1
MGSSRTQHPVGPAIRGGAGAAPYAAGPTAGAPAAAPSANGTAVANTGTATTGGLMAIAAAPTGTPVAAPPRPRLSRSI